MSLSLREPEEKQSKARALFHLVPVALLCLGVGWLFRYQLHRYFNPFTLLILLLPVAVPGLRRRYKLGLGFVILGFFGLGFFFPIALPPPYVAPLWGPELPPLTVNGLNPRTFQSQHIKAVKGIENKGEVETLETVLYQLSFARVQLALSQDGQIVDSRFHYLGDIGLAKPWKERDTFPQDGAFVGESKDVVEKAILELSTNQDPLQGEVVGEAWILGQGESRVVVNYGTQLTVYGNKIFQNTSLVGQVGQPLSQTTRERLDYTYTGDGQMFFNDYAFQSQPTNGRLFVDLDEQQRVQKVWSVYPLPMWLGDELYLEPWSPDGD